MNLEDIKVNKAGIERYHMTCLYDIKKLNSFRLTAKGGFHTGADRVWVWCSKNRKFHFRKKNKYEKNYNTTW